MFEESEIGVERVMCLNQGGFGVEGPWHCPSCAVKPLAIYTTWISLSTLKPPLDSILAVCPSTHQLKKWDLPLKNAQVLSTKAFHVN